MTALFEYHLCSITKNLMVISKIKKYRNLLTNCEMTIKILMRFGKMIKCRKILNYFLIIWVYWD